MKRLFVKRKRRSGHPTAPEASADVAFISGGLMAAMNTKRDVRESIIDDVSSALNCAKSDLEFLFSDGTNAEDEADVFDFPDAERRRDIIRANHIDAAE